MDTTYERTTFENIKGYAELALDLFRAFATFAILIIGIPVSLYLMVAFMVGPFDITLPFVSNPWAEVLERSTC